MTITDPGPISPSVLAFTKSFFNLSLTVSMTVFESVSSQEDARNMSSESEMWQLRRDVPNVQFPQQASQIL